MLRSDNHYGPETRSFATGTPISALAAHPVFRAVVRTVVPEAAALDAARWEALERRVGEALSDRPAALVRRLRLFLLLVQWAPALRYGRPFTALDEGRRRRFLARLQASGLAPVRLGFWGLRTLVFLGYYGGVEAAAEIGYRPDPRGWEAFSGTEARAREDEPRDHEPRQL